MRRFFLSCALYFTLSDWSSAAIIAQYTFGSPGNETTVETAPAFGAGTFDPNVVATAVADTSGNVGIEISSATTTPPNAPFLRIDPQGSSTDAATAVASSKYFSFSVTPNSGFQLDLTSLTFDAARGGGGTPRGYVVRSSIDGFTTNLAAADLLTARPTYTPVSIDLTGAAYQDLTNTLTFRVYSYSPAAGSSVDFDNFTLNGNVAAIPEPTLGALCMAVISGFVLLRRRYQE